MENLIFSLNATVPVFLLMVLGLFLRKIGWIDDYFADKINKFVFRVPLPLVLFNDLATVDFSMAWDTKFVLYCFAVTIISITISAAVSCLWKDKDIRGEFIQSCYRSSAALLGIAFIQNIYDSAGVAPLMIIGSVPLYNVMAVLVLSLSGNGRGDHDKVALKNALKGILTNPIILGITAGLLWSALKIPLPYIMKRTVENLSGLATPLGLIAMGASFDIKKVFAKIKPSVTAAFIKLIGFCVLFLPVAVYLGFRREELVAILVMLGSSTTVTGYVMARNMGHDGVLYSGVVMLTTLCSAFTLTGWLYVLRSLGLV